MFVLSLILYLVCIHTYVGNNIALLDPLGINDVDLDSAMPPELLAGESMDQDQVRHSGGVGCTRS